MYESRYVDGVARPDYDAEVSTIIDQLPRDGGGNRMRTGIENAAGVVYRIVDTHGMRAYLDLVLKLPGIGLIDELADMPSKAGFDSLFRVDPEQLRRKQQEAQLAAAQSAPSLSHPAALAAHAAPAAAVPTLSELPPGDSAASPPSPFDRTDLAADILAASADPTLEGLPPTERESIIQSRVGQGLFRRRLLDYWGGACAVTGARCSALLRASHIKPWRVASNVERLDVHNGLLLAPNLDAALDAGLITFDEHGRVAISTLLQGQGAYELHINQKMRLDIKRLTLQHHVYLEYHRSMVFER
jgi:hypothetical protein